ncbi:MAG: glycosyltransferase [Armatimonadetes bacterium]|nr:glycosyltransferase [Armatimonadota bacterium]
MKRPATILLALMKLDIGGAETHAVVLARHLTEMGYKVIMASNGGCFEAEIARYGVKHCRVPLHLPKISLIWRAAWAMRKIVREEKVDLIHAHARIPAFVTAVMGRPKNVRFITTAHFNFEYRYGLKYLSQWGEKTIAVSEDIKDHLIKHFRVPAENIVVIPNGIDTDVFHPLPGAGQEEEEREKRGRGTRGGEQEKQEDRGEQEEQAGRKGNGKKETCVTLVSRLDSEQLAGVAFNLIAACEQIYDAWPGVRLTIVGDGSKRPGVETRARQCNARFEKEIVSFLGARTDVNKIMAKSDLVVGVSRVALEAMACAKPVLLAGPQGFGGLLDPQKLAFFQKDNFTARSAGERTTAENLAASLQDFLNRPGSWRTAAGRVFREFIEKEYSSRQMAQRVARVYQEVLTSDV